MDITSTSIYINKSLDKLLTIEAVINVSYFNKYSNVNSYWADLGRG